MDHTTPRAIPTDLQAHFDHQDRVRRQAEYLIAKAWDIACDGSDSDEDAAIFFVHLLDRWRARKALASKVTTTRRKPFPKSLRTQIMERDAYRCVLCGDWHDLTIDHIVARARGGSDDPKNLRTLCNTCNAAKGVL